MTAPTRSVKIDAGPPAPVPAARARPREDKRLKGLGMVFVGGAAGCIGYLAANPTLTSWPLSLARLVTFAALVIVAANLLIIGLLVVAAGCGATHSASQPQRRRWAVLSRLALANALAPALGYAILTSDDTVNAELEKNDWNTVVVVAVIALVVLAWRLWRRSRQYGALSATDAMARDGRPPVVYLRSFHDDGEAAIEGAAGALARRVSRVFARVTPEQEIATILKRIGPVVAIGKPGEPLPELGAARVYVGNDEWQHQVGMWMRSASLVVIRVGASPGVLWELQQALLRLPRQRLVLVLLGVRTLAPEIAAALAPAIGTGLLDTVPDPPGRGWSRLLGGVQRRRVGSLVCFAADATARTVAVRLGHPDVQDMTEVTMPVMRPSAAPLLRAWREVFAHLGLPWEKAPPSRAMAAALALFMGWAGAHWFYLGDRRRGVRYVLMIPLLLAPFFLACYDAFRFIWVDRAEFDARFVVPVSKAGGA
jgi:hypothetical protein